MKKLKRFTLIVICFCMILSNGAFAHAESNTKAVNQVMTTTSQLTDSTLKYYAIVIGTTVNEVKSLVETPSQLNDVISDLLLSRRIADENYNKRNNINTDDVELSLCIDDCADMFDISVEEVSKHIDICGINVYNKIINSFSSTRLDNSEEVETMSSGSGSVDDEMDDELWRIIYTSAHTGNIIITKDSVNYGYRHGHVGIIQNHTSTPKQVVDAWQHSSGLAADEVLCSNLVNAQLDFSNRNTYWSKRNSVALTYPSNTTVQQRELAGNQTWFYAENSYYRYEAFNKKSTARDTNSRLLNCVGVPVRAYYFMAGVDIVPQVSNSSYLLPHQIYDSSVIAMKTYTGDGYTNLILMTPNFDKIDWGF